MARYGWRMAVLFGALSFSPGAWGQDSALEEIYGSGVHAYFSGNYQQALEELTQVVDGGSSDPRAYYFRALAELKLGMQSHAEADMQAGAKLETKATDRFYPISRSLERVQGLDRVALEKFRAVARVAAYSERQKKEEAKFERFRRDEQSVLRRPVEVVAPPKAALPAEKPKAKAAEKPAPADDDLFSEEPAAEEPAAAEPATEEPMAEEPAAEEPADAMPAEEAPAEEPAAEATEADPFGDDATQPAEEPAADEPAAEDPAPDDAPAEDMKKEPPAEEEDPFGA